MKARLPQGYQNSTPNMNQMVRKAQKMQEDIGKIQEELAVKEFTKQVGGGAIELVMTGDKQLKSVTIKPEVVDPEDIEMLQDLIIAAVNEAMRQVNEISESEMGKVTGGLNIPGLF